MRKLIIGLTMALGAATSAGIAQASCCDVDANKYYWNKCVPDINQCREHRNGYFFDRCGRWYYPDYQYERVMLPKHCAYGLCHKRSHYRGFYRVYNHEGLSYEIYTP